MLGCGVIIASLRGRISREIEGIIVGLLSKWKFRTGACLSADENELDIRDTKMIHADRVRIIVVELIIETRRVLLDVLEAL